MLLTAQLENETDRQFEFELVIKEGDPNPQTRRPHLLCPLKPLPPFETQTLKLSRVQDICKEEGPNWWIRVKYGDEFNFIYLHATDHLLRSTRIIFKCRPNGLFVPFVKAIEESGDHTTFIADFLLHLKWSRVIIGNDSKIWNNRRCTEIDVQADPQGIRNLREIEAAPQNVAPSALSNENTASLREVEDAPQNVAPSALSNENTASLRQGESSSNSATSPPQRRSVRKCNNGRGRAAARRATIPYFYLPCQQSNRHINILLFVLAFASVGFLWWMGW